jgi:hypothetical protein
MTALQETRLYIQARIDGAKAAAEAKNAEMVKILNLVEVIARASVPPVCISDRDHARSVPGAAAAICDYANDLSRLRADWQYQINMVTALEAGLAAIPAE